MSMDLKPCPFCGEEGHITMSSDGYGVECWNRRCTDMQMEQLPSEAEAVRAWNTRVERTCHDVYPMATYCFACSECGHTRRFIQGWNSVTHSGQDEFNYCPNCGAKVVEA